ncbi:MAG: hypothetical protein JXX14_09225 [Deltaproteobacteria bacterium]|nr:hypothetical protein [Deltaproteobacteria bacterium]
MKKVALILGLMIVCTVAASITMASDSKTYTAAFCVESEDTTPDIRYYNGGHARNYSSTASRFVCPAVSDDTVSSTIDNWSVTVYREASTTAWNVTLWNTARTGYSGYASTVTIPAGVNAYHTVNGGGISNTGADRVLFIESDVPAYGRIVSYKIQES